MSDVIVKDKKVNEDFYKSACRINIKHRCVASSRKNGIPLSGLVHIFFIEQSWLFGKLSRSWILYFLKMAV